jgi:hypothetical protein
MSINVLVRKIAKGPGTASIASLRAERPQPHEVAGFNLDPIPVEPVDRLALEHVQAMR